MLLNILKCTGQLLCLYMSIVLKFKGPDLENAQIEKMKNFDLIPQNMPAYQEL